MEIEFSQLAILDLEFWKKSGKKEILKKITSLLESISNDPFSGIGKPEPLKHEYSGYWSRRINSEHRIIYKVLATRVVIASMKGHY